MIRCSAPVAVGLLHINLALISTAVRLTKIILMHKKKDLRKNVVTKFT